MNRQSRLRKQWSSFTHVSRWTILDAALGAVCAALYGLLFAGLTAAIHHGDSGRILTTVAYFAMCGAIAGGLVGTIAALIDLEDSRKSARMRADSFHNTADLFISLSKHSQQQSERTSPIALPSWPRPREPDARVSESLRSRAASRPQRS